VRVAITGANGHLGVRLVEQLLPETEVRAIVRSERARSKLTDRFDDIDVCIVDYTDRQGLQKALIGCDAVVHLVGIIKESSASLFKTAHEDSCRVLVEAIEGSEIHRIVYMSIVGTSVDSPNRCLASKARAEKILTDSGIEADIIKVPMVLGEGDFASYALRKNAQSRFPITFRAASLEQPIYAGDVINAIANSVRRQGKGAVIQLAGAESISRRMLIERAAGILGSSTTVVSVPLWVGMTMAWLLEHLPDPPVSRAMLGVLDHDDDIEVESGCTALSIELTPLDLMLKKVLA